jgi:hypothetical protein
VFAREMVFVTPGQLEEAAAGSNLPPEPFENARAHAEAMKENRA